ncbi:MAG: lipoate--protein ligase family protein [Planctomycetes bacterium]|nr:lipoate--protein ligase family protein [Planctomycetota bacterium]
MIKFTNTSLTTLAENLALDEALLLDAEAGGPEVLRVWHWPTSAVVLGAGGRIADDVDEPACVADGVPIIRRSSGGGTVLLGAGCMLYSLVLRFDRHPALSDLTASYRFILGQIAQALAPLVSPVAIEGTSDLTHAGRKFSGNSQQRKRTHLLHHGTILLDFDVNAIARYLKMPLRQPEYRRHRSHADFLTNVPILANVVQEVLRRAWVADETMIDMPIEFIKRLVVEKYSRQEWTARR